MRTFVLLLLAAAAPTVAAADTDVPSSHLFAKDSVRVKDDVAVEKFLVSVAQHLKEDRSRGLKIVVHADERLGTTDNTWLANLRMQRLVVAMKKLGVRKKQLVSEAVGHSGVNPNAGTTRVVFDLSDDVYVAWPGEK